MHGQRRDTWVRGVRLASYEVGKEAIGTVVVVPGMCVASYLWPACDALAAEGFRVELVEPPGWPRSGRPVPEPADLAELAGWVADWLVTRRLRDVVLVGQSMGAQIGAHVAAQVPHLVRSVVLQGPVFDPAYRTPARALGRWFLDLPRERPTLAVREVPEWVRVGPRRVQQMLRLSLADRVEETVGGVAAPVLVVLGEHETLASRGWARTLARPPATPLIVPGLPHSSPHSDPQGLARLLRELIDGTPEPGGHREGSGPDRSQE